MLGLYAYKKFNPGNKEGRIVQTNKQIKSNTEDSLMNYILQSISSGQSKEHVKDSLLKAGWNEQTIDNYLSRL